MPLAFKSGKLLIKDGKLAFASSSTAACGCCCDPTPCGEITLRYVDENRCEDDVFDIYVYNPDTQARRLIGELDMKSTPPGCCGQIAGVPCPQTTVELKFTPTAEDIGADCTFGIQAQFKRSNCCGTLAKFTLIGPTGTHVDSVSFSTSGVKQAFSITDICAPGCGEPGCLPSSSLFRYDYYVTDQQPSATGTWDTPPTLWPQWGPGFQGRDFGSSDAWLWPDCTLRFAVIRRYGGNPGMEYAFTPVTAGAPGVWARAPDGKYWPLSTHGGLPTDQPGPGLHRVQTLHPKTGSYRDPNAPAAFAEDIFTPAAVEYVFPLSEVCP